MKSEQINSQQSYEGHQQAERDLTGRLYNRAKALYNQAEVLEVNIATIDNLEECVAEMATSVTEMHQILHEFSRIGDTGGEIFSMKGLAIIYQVWSDLVNDLPTKRVRLEDANDWINDAIIRAEKISWNQPSLPKRQGMIKVRLADVLHRINNHRDGNVLMQDGLKVLRQVIQRHPGYISAHIALIEADDLSNFWKLNKMSYDLRRVAQVSEESNQLESGDYHRLNRIRNRVTVQLQAY
jgi:hypothetical protein